MRTRFKLKQDFLVLLLISGVVIGGVYSVPTVKAGSNQISVTPKNPDGNNQYYRSQPTFTITSGRVGDGGDIYKMDSGDWSRWRSNCNNSSVIYLGPPKPFPIGIHTLYFANSSCGSILIPNGTVYSKIIKYDPNSPNITFTSPKENSTVNTNIITVKGTVSDPTSPVKTLTINGSGVGFSGNGSFSKQVNLIKGLNRIVGVVYDSAGNSTSEELFFTYTPGSQTSSNNSPQSSTSTGNGEATTLGQTLGELVDTVKDVIEGENKSSEATSSATSSASPSANTNNNDQTEDSQVEGAFFNNKVLITLFILIILSSAGVLAFKTEALKRFVFKKRSTK